MTEAPARNPPSHAAVPPSALFLSLTNKLSLTATMTSKKDPTNGDDSSDDEDYVPGMDGDASSDDDENDAPMEVEDTGALSITKLKAVDDAFYELFGYNYTPLPVKSVNKIPIKKSSKQRRILSRIFGKHSCIKLMELAKSNAALAKPKPSSGGMVRLEKRVIKEVKRFAGQEISVEKVVMVPVMMGESDNQKEQSSSTTTAAAADKATAQPKVPAKGLDTLLTTLSRPEKLSTISKTSADWDLFKTKNAPELKEELENKAHGKEAYLVKKDFLNRVDERRFEIEKGERDRERAKRGK